MSNIRRVYINSYLAYSNDAGESLTNFIAEFPETVNNPNDMSLAGASLMYYPTYPNFPLYESKIYMNATVGATTYAITISIPTSISYNFISATSTTDETTVINQLNNTATGANNVSSTPSLPTGLNTDVGVWSYDSTRLKIVFTPVAGCSVVFPAITSGDNNAYRRVGIAPNQLGTTYTSASPLTASSPPYIARTQVIYLSTNLSNDAMANSESSNSYGEIPYSSGIIAQIPMLNVAYGSIIQYVPTFDWGGLYNPRSFDTLNIVLLDDLFLPIEFSPNANLCLELYIRYRNEEDVPTAGVLKMPLTRPFNV
jgi:hypothetical protein